jgi:hypothetical protein
MGVIARIAVLCSQGFSKQAMTAEDIADNLEKIMSLEDARVADAVAPQL